nr:probable rRNA-processing protein EBP2 homolog [Aegilops tauschii subsp. strangulata]
MADGDDPAAFSAAVTTGGLTHVAAVAAMPPPPARRPGLAPSRPVATAPVAKPAKGRGGSVKRPANRSRNPSDSSTRPVKVSKAAAAARGDDSQTVRPAASSSSHTSIPQRPPPPPPAVEEDVATPTATASNMFDEMSQSVDDEAFMHATNVANDNYLYESQEYETQYDDDNLDVDDEGFVVKGRSGNYTTVEDKMIAQGLFRERNMKGEKKKRKGKAFTFHHCYKELKDVEKWKTRETFESSKKKSVLLEDEEDVAIEETSPTPHSATKSYRPDGNKKAKGTKARENDLKEGFDAIVMPRKEYAEEKRILKLKEIEERSEAERRRAAAKEKRAAAEERLAAAEERKVDLEEKKAAADERKMVEERTLKFMFMDTSTLDAKAKAYVELCRDEMLMKKQMVMRQMMMGGGMGGAMGGGMGDAMGGGMGGAMGGYMNMIGGSMNGAFGGNMGGGFGGNMEGGFGGMGGGFGGNMMGGLGGGYGGNMSGVGGGYGGNMGRNKDASGGAHGNESSPLLENVDKDGGGDDDHTTVHNAGGVDDPHE